MTTETIPRHAAGHRHRTGAHSREIIKINNRIATGLPCHQLRPVLRRKITLRSRASIKTRSRITTRQRPPKRPHGIMTTSIPRHRVDNNLKSRRRTSPHRPRPPRWEGRSHITIRHQEMSRRPRRRRLRHHSPRNRPSHRSHQTSLTTRIRTEAGGDIKTCPAISQSAAMKKSSRRFCFCNLSAAGKMRAWASRVGNLNKCGSASVAFPRAEPHPFLKQRCALRPFPIA